MLEEELVNLVRKVQKRQTEFQTVELKAAGVDFPKRIEHVLRYCQHQVIVPLVINPYVPDANIVIKRVLALLKAAEFRHSRLNHLASPPCSASIQAQMTRTAPSMPVRPLLTHRS